MGPNPYASTSASSNSDEFNYQDFQQIHVANQQAEQLPPQVQIFDYMPESDRNSHYSSDLSSGTLQQALNDMRGDEPDSRNPSLPSYGSSEVIDPQFNGFGSTGSHFSGELGRASQLNSAASVQPQKGISNSDKVSAGVNWPSSTYYSHEFIPLSDQWKPDMSQITEVVEESKSSLGTTVQVATDSTSSIINDSWAKYGITKDTVWSTGTIKRSRRSRKSTKRRR